MLKIQKTGKENPTGWGTGSMLSERRLKYIEYSIGRFFLEKEGAESSCAAATPAEKDRNLSAPQSDTTGGAKKIG